MLIAELAETCPHCGTPLSQRLKQPPWCGSCQWNLEAYEPDRELPFGVRQLARVSHRAGYRLDAALFAQGAGAPASRPGWSPARVLLVAVSAVLFALVLAAAALGLWLTFADFPSLTVIPGVLLLLIAWGLRPRLGRSRDEWGALTAMEAPHLHALVNEVAESVGTRPPDRVVVVSDFNAAASVVGVRRRRVLMIGLPLWGSLPEPERVALLAHEFGHFVNNDPARSLLTQPAVTVFGELAEAFSPHPLIAVQTDQSLELLNRIVYVALKPILWVLSRLLLVLHAGMLSFAMRDSHRAEYLADDIARRVAGTQATVGLLEALLLGPSTSDALRGIERSPGKDKRSWREAADAVRAAHVATMPLLRQFSLRDEASLFASHPPGGYRVRMIESRPELEPAVVLREQDAAAIDKELVRWYARAGRDIAE